MYTDELECRKYVKKHTFRHVCLYICVDSPHDSRKKLRAIVISRFHIYRASFLHTFGIAGIMLNRS